MKYPRCVYAIYTIDENKTITGVYIGSTFNLAERFVNHINSKGKVQSELHELMRANNYYFEILTESTDQRTLEYDWIDFFKTQTSIPVLNQQGTEHGDYRRCSRIFECYIHKPITAVPIWNNGGVVWQLNMC